MTGDVLRGNLEMLLLAALAETPAHGYALIDRLRTGREGVLELTEGSVYPALHRLEKGDFVTSSWTMAEGRPRRTYRLTRRGRGKLGTDSQAWRQLVRTIDVVLSPG